MFRLFILISFVCFSFVLSAQHDASCREGKKRFYNDRDTGTVKVFEAGARDWSGTRERLMLERYNVEIVETYLFGLYRWMHCYNELSLAFIEENYGPGVIAKVGQEARDLDEEGKGDRRAELLVHRDTINRYFQDRIDPAYYRDFLPGSVHQALSVYAHLYTDTYTLAEEASKYVRNLKKIAVVCDEKYLKMGQFYETVASNRGLTLRISSSMEDAELWLEED